MEITNEAFVLKINEELGSFAINNRMKHLLVTPTIDVEAVMNEFTIVSIVFDVDYDGGFQDSYVTERYEVKFLYKGVDQKFVACTSRYENRQNEEWFLNGEVDCEDFYTGHYIVRESTYAKTNLNGEENDFFRTLLNDFQLLNKCINELKNKVSEYLQQEIVQNIVEHLAEHVEVEVEQKEYGALIILNNTETDKKTYIEKYIPNIYFY